MRIKLNSYITDALRKAIEEYGSQSELARRSGVRQGTISNILNPNQQQIWILDVMYDRIYPFISRYLPPEMKKASVTTIHGEESNVSLDLPSHGMSVPIIGIAEAASCNPGFMPLIDCVNERSEEKVFFPEARQGDFVIRVTGTSMSPWYPDGTLLLVRPYQELVNGDRVVVALDTGEIVFKVYAKKGKQICLFSIDDCGHDYVFELPNVPIRYICQVIASLRDERAMDAEMNHAGVRHRWQDKLNEIES